MAQKRVAKLIFLARANKSLDRMGPRAPWSIEVKLVNRPTMSRLNAQYRGKSYATDILSFPPPDLFRNQGLLGELVICMPRLREQAKERGHRAELELEVLLVHGLLHLLGLDHEESPREAVRMAKWESYLLKKCLSVSRSTSGLIDRANSDTERE